jgi:hypothetical protein
MPGAGNPHETFGRPDQGIKAFAECKGNYTIVFAVNYQHRCSDLAATKSERNWSFMKSRTGMNQ